LFSLVSGQRSCQETCRRSRRSARVKSGQIRGDVYEVGGRLAHSLHAHHLDPQEDVTVFHSTSSPTVPRSPRRRHARRAPQSRRSLQRNVRGVARPSNCSFSPRSRGRRTVIVRPLDASRRRPLDRWREPTDVLTATRRRRPGDRRKDGRPREASESGPAPTPVGGLLNASMLAETDSPLVFRQLADLSDGLGSLSPHEKSRGKRKCHSDGPS
jgi:hypothetical protein